MLTWAEKYTNIPYKLFGNSPQQGMDCFNLVVYIFQDKLKIDIPYKSSDFLKIVDEAWFEKTHEEHFLNGSQNGDWIEVNELQPFDLIVMCLGSTNVCNHVAMYIGDNKIIQMMQNRPSGIYKYHRYYKQYTVKKVRWKNLKNY
jgi:cell wall-associated NlpC family hydrolase